MLTANDLLRFDLLETAIRNWPGLAHREQAFQVGFILNAPNEIDDDAEDVSSIVSCEWSVLLGDQEPTDEDEEKEPQPIWKGQFKFGFQVPRDKYLEVLESDDSARLLINAAWPHIRAHISQVLRMSVATPPLPFEVLSLLEVDEDILEVDEDN